MSPDATRIADQKRDREGLAPSSACCAAELQRLKLPSVY